MGYTTRGIYYPETSATVRPASYDFRTLAITTDAAIGEAAEGADGWANLSEPLAEGEDVGNLPAGVRSVWNGTVAGNLGFPTANEGVVITYRYGSIDQQTWMPATPEPQMWMRTKRISGWTDWLRTDSGATAAKTPPAPSGLKQVPLALSATASNATTTTDDEATVRFPIRYGATIPRFRLHVSNRLERGNTELPGDVTIDGIWFGEHAASDPAFSGAPVQLHGAASLPADGTEWVSPWFSREITADVDYLLSVGFHTVGQESVLATAGAWTHPSSSVPGQQSGDGFTMVDQVPLSWWIEAEAPATVPVLAGFGDSNTIGTGATLEVFDSWLSQYCRQVGALPIHQAYPGTAMSEWRYAEWLWERWDAYTRADAVIVAMGINDLAGSITTAEMQARLGDMVPRLLEHVAPVIHYATITPSSTKTGSVNTARQGYNAWLSTLPHGGRDVHNFAAAVDDGTGTAMDPAYSHPDGLHVNTTGHTALAGAIVRAPITVNA